MKGTKNKENKKRERENGRAGKCGLKNIFAAISTKGGFKKKN